MNPPPPYASVLADDGSAFASTSSGPAHQQQAVPELNIQVANPVKHGDGVASYVTYSVKCTRLSGGVSEVHRRFSDFTWLHTKLAEKHKGCIVPCLPEKSAVQKFQMSTEFIAQRQRALQVFLNKVAAHPVLKDSKELHTFLTANEQEWTLEMARWQAESAASRPTNSVSGALAWLKGLQHSAQNMVAGRSDDALEDAEYLKVRDYINHLEGHLVEAHRQAARLVRKEAELSGALASFGLAAEQLGKFDEGPVRGALDVLCARSGQIAAASRQRADAMALSFEEPLKEAARTIKGVQAAMADRGAAMSALCQAKSELDSRKVKLAKLRGTPGIKEDKLTEAERDVTDGETRVNEAKIAYDAVVARMTEELNRFQKERASEMGRVLRDFALAQAQAAAENAKAWAAMLGDMQTHQDQYMQSQGQGSLPAATQVMS